jgi:hypothetical protein
MTQTVDPTFYRSPAEAIAAPPERLAHVAAYDPEGTAKSGCCMPIIIGTWSAVLQAQAGTTGTSALLRSPASWAALVTAWSR